MKRFANLWAARAAAAVMMLFGLAPGARMRLSPRVVEAPPDAVAVD